MSMWNDLKERLEMLKLAKKNMYTPKEKKDPNIIKMDPMKMPPPHRMDPDELQDSFRANRGTGFHTNNKDKRAKNPNKNIDGDG